MKRYILCATIGLFAAVPMYALTPFGLVEPYNFIVQPAMQSQDWQVMGGVEHAVRFSGYNAEGASVDPLAFIEDKQNIIEFLNGSDNAALQSRLAGIAPEFGACTVTGDFAATQYNVGISRHIGNNIFIQAYIPWIRARLSGVKWDYAGAAGVDALQVQQYLPQFAQDVKETLDFDVLGWKRSGFGNAALLVAWQQNFPQYRPLLKNVGLTLHGGLSLPTGVKEDVSVLYGIPFSAGGALGIPFGGQIDLRLLSQLQVGVAAQFWHYASAQGLHRIRTSAEQTSLLLPRVSQAIRNYGFTQQFNLYAQWYLVESLYAKCAYQYTRQSQDILSPVYAQSFDFHTMNVASDLDERSMHYALVGAYYDTRDLCASRRAQIGVQARIPFNGMHSVLATTVGLHVSVDF